MSIPLQNPIVETGDSEGSFEAWRVTGLDDDNSDRGKLYVNHEASGGDVQISVYSNFERTSLVAQGTGTLDTRVTATPQNNSGLTVSAIVADQGPGTIVEIVVQLATQTDIAEREDELTAFLLGNPPEIDFDVIARATMRKFYLEFQSIFPPPQGLAHPLAFPGSGQRQIAGSRGLPDFDANELWNCNVENDWEITGLQNPTDWKEWAILWSLHLIWKRKAGSQDDPMLARSQAYKEEADEAFFKPPVLIDVDQDRIPDRQVKTRTPRLRRG